MMRGLCCKKCFEAQRGVERLSLCGDPEQLSDKLRLPRYVYAI